MRWSERTRLLLRAVATRERPGLVLANARPRPIKLGPPDESFFWRREVYFDNVARIGPDCEALAYARHSRRVART